jgi:uncharacterized membrane protein YphA (DoxX/SURF4 family)
MKRIWIIIKYVGRRIALRFWHIFDRIWDFVAREWSLLVGEGRLYLGAALFIAGLFSWKADKYCDGNTAEYFACTHPVPYYYYPWWVVLIIVVGVLLLLGWWRHSKT